MKEIIGGSAPFPYIVVDNFMFSKALGYNSVSIKNEKGESVAVLRIGD